MAKGETYEDFISKFNTKKHKPNTDDCYTPPEIYEAVRQWVNDKVMPIEGVHIVRPFYPGGDYEHYDYPEGCLVLDNPPFSISRQIIRFYDERDINYFLFANGLTLFNSLSDKNTCILACGRLEYENGAKISTGFVTNVFPDNPAFVVAGDLFLTFQEIQDRGKRRNYKTKPVLKRFDPHVLTAASIQHLCTAGKFFVAPRNECQSVNVKLDCQVKPFGTALYVSDRIADFCQRHTEITNIELSEREWNIISELNRNQP